MLTLRGYRIEKKGNDVIRGTLTVKPYVPAVFVNPQYVTKYKVYTEDSNYLYVPKHFGIQTFGPFKDSERNVISTNVKYWEFSGTIRESQKGVVDSYLKPEPHDGVISLQTGGGKTVCGLYIASVLRLQTIVLVHNTFLRDQWIDRIKAFLPKARIGIWNDDDTVDTFIQDFVIRVDGDEIKYKNTNTTPNFKLLKNIKESEISSLSKIMNVKTSIEDILENIKEYVSERDITIGMIQGIMRDSVVSTHFKNIGFLIVDECHHIASEAFCKAIPKLTCKHMLGLSATPERKDRLMHVINWFLGPILYKSDNADKSDDKVRVEVHEFEPADHTYNDIIYNHAGVMFTSLMINKVVEYEPRNLLLVELLKDIMEEPERQVLVLTDRVDHAKNLFKLLPPEIQEMACVLGRDVKANKRAEFCSIKRILIATYSMCKEGFDLETLNTLLMATPRPDIEQIIGRILRIDKNSRTIDPLVIDVVDPAFRRQFQSRNHLYKQRNYNVTKMKFI